MPQEYFRQSNFTNGELDQLMLGRRDLKFYFASVAAGENHLQRPQGPIGRRPGLAYVGRIRNPMTAVDIPVGAITAPNGGAPDTARAAGDALPVTTVAMGVVDPYVVLEIDFGVAVAISCVDVIDYAAVAAGGGGAGYTPPPTPIDPYPGTFDPSDIGPIGPFGGGIFA